MNYKLCKKLKDAGFPQASTHFAYRVEYHGDKETVLLTCGENYECKGTAEDGQPAGVWLLAAPTLSELIEACAGEYDGDMFRLEWLEGQWQALVGNKTRKDKIYRAVACGDGTTTKEAVANLWLAHHKK